MTTPSASRRDRAIGGVAREEGDRSAAAEQDGWLTALRSSRMGAEASNVSVANPTHWTADRTHRCRSNRRTQTPAGGGAVVVHRRRQARSPLRESAEANWPITFNIRDTPPQHDHVVAVVPEAGRAVRSACARIAGSRRTWPPQRHLRGHRAGQADAQSAADFRWGTSEGCSCRARRSTTFRCVIDLDGPVVRVLRRTPR